MDFAIVDCRADNETIYTLEAIGIKVIPTIKIDGLYDAVATHPDIQIHYLGNCKFLCAPEVYSYYKKILSKDVILIKGQKKLGVKYPDDIAYNAAVLKDYVICNSQYTAPEIISEYQALSKTILNVKQGYSKCNLCIVNGCAVITSDKGIMKSINNIDRNIEVLLIGQGHINLREMPYGFIGGTSGLIKKNVLAVNGNINLHPDGNRIKLFCKKYDVDIITLKTGILTDIGSIITKNTF